MKATAPLRGKRKSSLREILIAGTILTVLSAALMPLVVNYIDDGDRARALSDSRTLGRAILIFHLDTGSWPVSEDKNTTTGEISRLVGLPAEQISAASIPGGAGSAGGWSDGGIAGGIEDHLIRNQRRGMNPIYATSATAPEPPGWNGPYLRSIPLDPWDRPYVCNTRYLEGARIPGVTTAESDNHAVFCMSAGPNGVFDTALVDGAELSAPEGDDIGWPIQAHYSR